MSSSLPWRYLHFTTSNNNRATSSLKKGKIFSPSAMGERFITTFVKGAKIKSFFIPILKLRLVSFCPLSPKWDTQHAKPHPLTGQT